MSKSNDSTNSKELEWDRKRAIAFSDLETDVCSMHSAARLNELLAQTILKQADAEIAAKLSALREQGYRIYVLTEAQDDVLHHAIYHAGDVAMALYKKWHDVCEDAA